MYFVSKVKASACLLLIIISLFATNLINAQSSENPVLLRRTVAQLTTVPFTEGEFRRLFEYFFSRNAGKTSYVNNFAIIDSAIEVPALEKQNRRSALYFWDADLIISEAADYSFNISDNSLPWALFLNGQYVDGWFEPAENKILSLPTGTQRLQLVVIQKYDSKIPTLNFSKKTDDKFAPEKLQLAPVSNFVFAENSEEAKKWAEITKNWRLLESWHFLAVDKYLNIFSQKDAKAKLDKLYYLHDNENYELATETNNLLLPGRTKLNFSTSQATEMIFTSNAHWSLARPCNIKINLLPKQLILSAQDKLTLKVRQFVDRKLPKRLQENWNLLCFQVDKNGKLLEKVTVSKEFSELSDLEISLNEQCHTIKFQVYFANVAASNLAELHIVQAEQFNQQISFRGNQLLYQDSPAVLKCKALTDTINKPEKKQVTNGKKIYYFDEGLGGFRESKATRSHKTKTEQKDTKKIARNKFGRVLIPGTVGADVQLQSVKALHKMLTMKPDSAILNLGRYELQSDIHPLLYCKQMLFFAQACQANDIEPIFVTMPELPDIDSALARESALLLKEMAIKLNIKVIDLYSQRILEDIDTASWFVEGDVQHQAINSKAWQWLAENMAQNLVAPAKRSKTKPVKN